MPKPLIGNVTPKKTKVGKRSESIEFKDEYAHLPKGIKDNVTLEVITPKDGQKWLKYLDWLSQNSMNNPILPKFK